MLGECALTPRCRRRRGRHIRSTISRRRATHRSTRVPLYSSNSHKVLEKSRGERSVRVQRIFYRRGAQVSACATHYTPVDRRGAGRPPVRPIRSLVLRFMVSRSHVAGTKGRCSMDAELRYASLSFCCACLSLSFLSLGVVPCRALPSRYCGTVGVSLSSTYFRTFVCAI